MIKYDGQAIQVLRTSHVAIGLEEGEHDRLNRENLLGYLKTIATSFPVWP